MPSAQAQLRASELARAREVWRKKFGALARDAAEPRAAGALSRGARLLGRSGAQDHIDRSRDRIDLTRRAGASMGDHTACRAGFRFDCLHVHVRAKLRAPCGAVIRAASAVRTSAARPTAAPRDPSLLHSDQRQHEDPRIPRQGVAAQLRCAGAARLSRVHRARGARGRATAGRQGVGREGADPRWRPRQGRRREARALAR